jgi:capsular polysaccharide biosynthesis protein
LDHQEIDLRELLSVLRRRVLLIVALPVVAVVVAALVSQFVLKPVYQASTTLWVIKDGSAQINYNDLLLNRNLTKTYAEVAKSRAVMADVIQRLGLHGVTVEQLQALLTVTPVRDTEILSFTVEHEDPAMAAKLADAIAESFKGQIRTYMKVENVVVVDPAMEPTAPFKPRKLINVAVAFILGLMASVGLAFLLEFLDTTIKSPDDVTRHIGLPVLAMIPAFEPEAEAEQAEARHKVKRRSAAHREGEADA